MIISDLLSEMNMSQYRLSKESGVGQATISDLCSGKSSVEKCAAGTLYKIAKVLGTTVDALIEADAIKDEKELHSASFQDGYPGVLNEDNLSDILKAVKTKMNR